MNIFIAHILKASNFLRQNLPFAVAVESMSTSQDCRFEVWDNLDIGSEFYFKSL